MMNLFDSKYEPENYNHAEPKERSDALKYYDNIKDYKSYGLTFKIMNKTNLVLEDYKDVIKKVQDRSELFNYVVEDKSKNGSPCKLHIHGIAYFKVMPRFSTFSQHGLHTRFEPIYDKQGWLRYMNKNQ